MTYSDDFNKNFVRHIIVTCRCAREYATAQKLRVSIKEAAGFESIQDFMVRMLKTVCLKWLRRSVNMGERFCWNGVVLKPKNLEIAHNDKATIYYWDESSINQNHTETICCKTKKSFSSLRVPVKKVIALLHLMVVQSSRESFRRKS